MHLDMAGSPIVDGIRPLPKANDRPYVGLDIGATKWLVIAARQGSFRTVAEGTVVDDPTQTIDAIGSRLLAEHRTLHLSGACAFAGAVDLNGMVTGWPSRPAWSGYPLREALSALADGPVRIEDDGVCAAIGELEAGVAHGFSDFLCVTLGTGIGGALVINRKVRRPSSETGRTIGHIRIDNGRACACGRLGCIQALYRSGGKTRTNRDDGEWIGPLARLAADVSLFAGVEAVVLTGGLIGHQPGLAQALLREVGREMQGEPCVALLSRRPESSAAIGAACLTAAPTDL